MGQTPKEQTGTIEASRLEAITIIGLESIVVAMPLLLVASSY